MAGPIRISILANAAQAKSEITGVADTSESAFSKARDSAKRLVEAFALFEGLRKVVDVLKDSVEEARNAQKITAQTGAVIKSTGGAANVSAKHVSEYADQLGRMSGQNADIIQQGANLLLTFQNVQNQVGKGNNIFDQATKLALNMSTALGTSATSSAKQLGKALNDPVKGLSALTRIGVTFTAQQSAQITKLATTGKTLQAQKIILGQLDQKFAGSAKAQATSGGKLKETWRQTEVEIGDHLLPILDKVENYLVQKLPGWFEDAKRAGDKAKDVFGPIVDDVKTFFQTGGGHPAVVATLETVRDDAKRIAGFFDTAKTSAKNFFGSFKGADASQIGKLIGTSIADGLDTLVNDANQVNTSIEKLIGKIDWGNLALAFGKEAPVLVLGLATGILNFNIGPIFSFVGQHWFEVLLGVLTIVFAPSKFLKPVDAILTKIPFVGRFLSVALHWLNDLGGSLKGFGGDLLGKFFSGFADQIGERFPKTKLIAGVLDGLSGLPGRIGGFFKTLETRIGVWALDAFGAAGRAAADKAADLVKFEAALPGRILRALGGLGKTLFGVGADLIEGLLAGIRSKAGEIVSTIKSYVTDKIPGFVKKALGIFSPSKVFRGFGVNLIEGLLLGIRDKQGDLRSTLQALTDLTKSSIAPLDVSAALKRPSFLSSDGTLRVDVNQGKQPPTKVEINVTAPIGSDPYTIGQQLHGYLSEYFELGGVA